VGKEKEGIMARKIEDMLAKVWPILQKQGLDDLQIYRIWQIIIGNLAEAGWLRKRPGKPDRQRAANNNWEPVSEAEEEMWVQMAMNRYSIESGSKKKDHISTTELIDQGAKEERRQARSMGREALEEEIPLRVRKKKRASEW
jgi:hypothetical protein